MEQGNWSIEKPFIDPLGSEGSYREVNKYYETGEIKYINEDFRLTTQKVAGDFWVMRFDDDSSDVLLHLEKYITDMGGEILSPADNEIVFKVEEGNYIWWGKVTREEYLEIELYREFYLKVGETLTVTPADREKNGNTEGPVFLPQDITAAVCKV